MIGASYKREMQAIVIDGTASRFQRTIRGAHAGIRPAHRRVGAP
ncbi:MAG: hypothetical protein ACLP22_22370 [Solirubrobacteraceae bacterium]